MVGAALLTGCDTPWAAAKREREGITWEQWRAGIRKKEDLPAVAVPERSPDANFRMLTQQVITKGLHRGMEGKEVLAWIKHEPDRRTESVGPAGRQEQWSYDTFGIYLYFDGAGKLDGWQTL